MTCITPGTEDMYIFTRLFRGHGGVPFARYGCYCTRRAFCVCCVLVARCFRPEGGTGGVLALTFACFEGRAAASSTITGEHNK